jgi:hypothetical protein
MFINWFGAVNESQITPMLSDIFMYFTSDCTIRTVAAMATMV